MDWYHQGQSATVYEGLTHKLTLKFPTDHRHKPPSVKFDTLCFHPNVDQYGNFCLDMLQVNFFPHLVLLALAPKGRNIASMYNLGLKSEPICAHCGDNTLSHLFQFPVNDALWHHVV
jgi:hypothetical protein